MLWLWLQTSKTQSTTRPSGAVTLGLPHSISGALALPLLMAARERYPEITLQLTEELSGSLAEQLKSGAMLVNPYDVEQMADTLLKAFQMRQAERTARMKRMRRIVRNENVFWWVNSFLKAGAKLTTRSSRLRDHRVRGTRKRPTPNVQHPTNLN